MLPKSMIVGDCLSLLEKRIANRFSNKNEIAIAVISAVILFAFLSGLYASFSVKKPRAPVATIVIMTQSAGGKPMLNKILVEPNATKAPTMMIHRSRRFFPRTDSCFCLRVAVR